MGTATNSTCARWSEVDLGSPWKCATRSSSSNFTVTLDPTPNVILRAGTRVIGNEVIKMESARKENMLGQDTNLNNAIEWISYRATIMYPAILASLRFSMAGNLTPMSIVICLLSTEITVPTTLVPMRGFMLSSLANSSRNVFRALA